VGNTDGATNPLRFVLFGSNDDGSNSAQVLAAMIPVATALIVEVVVILVVETD
jgi:hypothetical protein